MTPWTVQLLILIGAYVLVVGASLVNGLLALYNYRLSSQLIAKRDLSSRLTALQAEVHSLRDLTDTFSKRMATRERRASRASRGDEPDQPSNDFEPRTPDEVLAKAKANGLI